MKRVRRCGVDCDLCDCGRTDSICKWQKVKKRIRLVVKSPVVSKPKESKSAKKKRRKKGRR